MRTWPKQFTIYTRIVGTRNAMCPEPYHVRTRDALQWARNTLDKFNATRRPGEPRRELIGVIEESNDRPLKHLWHKTNLVTIMRGGSHDTYRCDDCGATSKRYGIGGEFTPDKKQPAECPGPPYMRRIRKTVTRHNESER